MIGSCDVSKHPHIFLTSANQHIQEINIHFGGYLNHLDPMLFAVKKEQNESYTFRDILLQPSKSDFIQAMIKEVESHETRSC